MEGVEKNKKIFTDIPIRIITGKKGREADRGVPRQGAIDGEVNPTLPI